MLNLFFIEKRQCSHYDVHFLIHFPLGFEINAKKNQKNVLKYVKWSCQNKRGYIKRGLLSGPTRVLVDLVERVRQCSQDTHKENTPTARLY